MTKPGKDATIYLDSDAKNVSGKLWQYLPDATDMQHMVLRALFVGYGVAVNIEHADQMFPTSYPNHKVTIKASFSSTTDGSVYMALTGNDGVEYMKVTVSKESINDAGYMEGGQIRFYQNPNNKTNQLLKHFAALKDGWDNARIYTVVRTATEELMARFKKERLYKRIVSPNEKVAGYQCIWVQRTAPNLNPNPKEDEVVHLHEDEDQFIPSEPVVTKHELTPEQWGQVIQPNIDKVTLIPMVDMSWLTPSKKTVEPQANVTPKVVKQSNFLDSAFDALNSMMDYNRGLEIAPSVRAKRSIKLPFLGNFKFNFG